jgi:hypothetical protein
MNMSYYVEVRVDKVVCRNPESVTTADRFAMISGAVTDRGPDGKVEGEIFVSPLRLLRRNESASFFETIYKGFSSEPKIGLLLRAWDKDLNSAWVNNQAEIVEVKNKVAEALEAIPVVGDVGAFFVNFTYTGINVFVNADLDDELVSYFQWVYFDQNRLGYDSQQLFPVEVKFSREDLTGFSDWDYSVLFTIAVTELPPGFGTSPKPTAWRPSRGSRASQLHGRYTGGSIECRIDLNPLNSNLMDVTIIETASAPPVSTVTNSVPVSRIFAMGGIRELETQGSIIPDLAARSPSARGNGDLIPRLVVENSFGGRFWSEGTLGGSAFPTRPVLREQIGSDFLRLNNLAVLEIYEEGLLYLRSVYNVLYRETSFDIAVQLFKQQV